MRLLAIVLLAPLLLLPRDARASSALEPTHISLPSGPGSIEGLGRNFAPSLASGTASYGVDIAVPPSAGGFAPHVSLDYDSAGGVTEVGMGWRIAGIPSVRRRSENGLPRFGDQDAFEVVGMGVPCDLLEMPDGTFRPQYESGAFVRAERAGSDAWQVREKSGTTWRFGGSGFEEAEGPNVSTYLLHQALDLHGHVINYRWDAASGYALIEQIVWNDFGESARNEIVFAYENRPDSHILFSAGIRRALTKRLTGIEVRHGGSLVRRYELTYANDTHSRLASVTLVGRDGVSRLPTLSLGYTAQTFEPQLVAMQNPPGRTPGDPNVELADLDGDGLPDLLVTGQATGAYRSYLNQDGRSWQSGIDWDPTLSPALSLATVGVQLADVDGDGAMDLLVKSGTRAFRYFPGNDATSFRAPIEIPTVPNFTFEDPDAKLADMDGDRRADVVVTTAEGIAIGYNLDGVDWTVPEIVGTVDAKQPLRFSDGGHTQLCDVNGDRVEDFCYLTPGSLVYWLGRGRGVFEPAELATGVPTFDPSSPWELHDLNGDGWVDLVHVGANAVDVALAHAAGQFDAPLAIGSVPQKGPNTVIRFADMNASGTVDIVWIDVSGGSSPPWQYLELFPSGRAGLLDRINNGLGKVTAIKYRPAAIDAAAARASGAPWPTRVNVPIPVVGEVDIDDSLGDPTIVTQYAYANGTWSPVERTFAGFGGGSETDVGDSYTPTLLTATTFDVGLVDREMRGRVVTNQTSDTTGVVFGRTTDTWATRSIDTAVDGRTVRYSFRSSEQADSIEGRDVSKARSTLTEWDEDDFGNVVRESKWGEVVAGNKLAGGDEAITLRTLANNRQDWILGRLATEELQDAGGRRVRMKRFYYDGPAFQGLPLGEVARGDLTRQEEWVGPDPNAFELDMATQYDADGHPVETTDARGGGHRFQWDPADRTTLLGESARLEWGLLVEQFDTDRAFGNVTSATGCDSQTTVYQYDPFGRLTAVIRPGDSSSTPTVRYQYVVTPPLSRVISERRVATDSDPDERSEDLVDGLGRKRGTLTRDESSRWVFAGVSVLDSRGQGRRALRAHFATKAEHDTPPLHADAPGVDSWHDALARTIRTRTQLGIETRTALAPFEKRIWDGAQNDPTSPYEHTPTVSEQDGLGRLVRTTYTLGGRPYAATYVYDATGALVSKTDAEGNVSRYLYDGRGRRTLVKDPDAGMHMFVYDATGNLVEHHYPDGSVGRFAFDLGGRPISEDWDGDGTPEVLHTWDRSDRHPSDPLYLGKLVTMKDPSGLLENEYDSRQRVIAQHVTLDGHTYVVASAYDDQNREVLHTYPDQSSLRIHFNPRGQVAAYGQAVRFTYDGSGVESQRDFSTGVTERRAYDADLRRIESRVSSPAGSLLQDLRWTYDGAGNLTSVQDARPRVDPVHDRSEKYAFDNFYRLHTATGPWGSAAWTYSPSGNLVSRTSSVAALNSGILTYGAGSHALTAIAGRVVGYDARGRITSDGDRTYTWNGDDQLLHVQSATGASVDSVFDGGGERRRRIERSANGQSRTTYFIDPWCEVRDGKLVRFIVHGGKRIAELSGETGAGAGTAGLLTTFDPQRGRDAKARLVAMGRNAPTTLVGIALLLALAIQGWNRADRKTRMLAPAACALSLLSLAACGQGTSESSALGRTIQTLSDSDTLLFDDAIGSLTEQTSGTGTLQAEFAVYPYGVTRFDSSIETRKYANSPRDSSVGLDQMGARAYAADLGVWTSADPIAVEDPARAIGSAHGAVNPYGYAGQTPTVATDEHGHWWQIALGVAVGAAVGGAAEALRQYSESGHITDWGRVANHAAVGAAAVGVASILPTPATIAESISLAAAEGAAIGTANRLLDSGGKSAGTVGDVVVDAAIGAATGGIYSGGSKLVRNAAIASVRRSTANGVLERVGPLQGREASRIEAKLSRDGFSGVPANDGVGRVWTKPGSDGNTASVRIDPAKVRTPPKGWADEVPHAHKETVASSKVFNGNYDRPDVRYDDQCNVSEDMRAVHIEIKW